jgi:hypothetical protein
LSFLAEIPTTSIPMSSRRLGKRELLLCFPRGPMLSIIQVVEHQAYTPCPFRVQRPCRHTESHH